MPKFICKESCGPCHLETTVDVKPDQCHDSKDDQQSASWEVVEEVKNPIGMYGETPRVKIGDFTICRQDDNSVWIEKGGDEGFQCADDVFEAAIGKFYSDHF